MAHVSKDVPCTGFHTPPFLPTSGRGRSWVLDILLSIASSSWQHKPTSICTTDFFPEWPMGSTQKQGSPDEINQFQGGSFHGAGVGRDPKRVIKVDPLILVTEAPAKQFYP
ncbi:hypothetical protein MaudCBS49596_004959 [Microsporum audouinii]